MTDHVSIETRNAWVEFPIFDAKSRSLKKAFLGKAGGAIGRNQSDVVVVEALRDITLSLKEGDRIGLVGHNGAGKSTLLRLLSGIYEPSRGSARIRGRVAPVFDLGVGMDPEISGYENIIIRGLFLGQTRKQMMAKIDEIADFTELGEYLSMPLRTYSTGMRVRLAMGVVTSIDPEILLLDEGIGAVDAEFMKKPGCASRNWWPDPASWSSPAIPTNSSPSSAIRPCGSITARSGCTAVSKKWCGPTRARRRVITSRPSLPNWKPSRPPTPNENWSRTRHE